MENKTKKIIFDILIAIICIGIIIGMFLYVNSKKKSEDFDPINYDTFNLKITYKDDLVIFDEHLEFTEGETLYHILTRDDIKFKYKISMSCREDSVGKAVLSFTINGVLYDSDWFDNCYFIYLDDQFATEGVEQIKVSKDMKVDFKWTSLN